MTFPKPGRESSGPFNLKERIMPAPSEFKNSFRLYLRLLAYLRDYRGRTAAVLLFMVVSAAATALFFYQLKPIMDASFIQTDHPDSTFHHLAYFTVPLTFLAAVVR